MVRNLDKARHAFSTLTLIDTTDKRANNAMSDELQKIHLEWHVNLSRSQPSSKAMTAHHMTSRASHHRINFTNLPRVDLDIVSPPCIPFSPC